MKTLYVLVNASLKMSTGKACSQVAHAVAKLACVCDLNKFGKEDPNRVVVLSATDQGQMDNISAYLIDQDISHTIYVDEGNHETPPFSETAMAIQPLDPVLDEDIINALSTMPTYPKKRRLW